MENGKLKQYFHKEQWFYLALLVLTGPEGPTEYNLVLLSLNVRTTYKMLMVHHSYPFRIPWSWKIVIHFEENGQYKHSTFGNGAGASNENLIILLTPLYMYYAPCFVLDEYAVCHKPISVWMGVYALLA